LLLGLPLSGVLTVKSKSVLDDGMGLLGAGTKVADASATGGGHLVDSSVSAPSADKGEEERGGRDTYLFASICELASPGGAEIVWALLTSGGFAGA
jgi:hypothetical protein